MNQKLVLFRATRVKVKLLTRPLSTLVAQICAGANMVYAIHEHNMCSFLNTTSHRNRLLLFTTHLAIRDFTSK